jgi:aspartyl-tRNA(Asn)/glutamyl-tRNA(Gln) amidotransferase subunit C
MPGIDKDAVRHVALLESLELNDKDLALYSYQLASIIKYISKLKEIDTATVPPTSHAVATLKNVFRKDVLKKSLKVEEALNNAPSKDGDFFKVPQVIEGK